MSANGTLTFRGDPTARIDVVWIEVIRVLRSSRRRLRRVSDYKKLRVWRKAHCLAINAHRVASRIRGPQYAAFRNQVIRAAMSVATNIVEGREQKTEAGFARFLRISLGSLSEVEYHLLVGRDIGALSTSDHRSLSSQVEEVRMMLYGLVRKLESPGNSPDQPPRKVNRSSAGRRTATSG